MQYTNNSESCKQFINKNDGECGLIFNRAADTQYVVKVARGYTSDIVSLIRNASRS